MRQLDFLHCAAILVGGLGSRLGPLVAATPKPLLEVSGRPFLDYLLYWLADHGCRRVVLLAGYLGEVVRERYGQGDFGPLAIDVLVEPRPLGTAGAVIAALERLPDEFLLLNGDSWFAIDPRCLAQAPSGPWSVGMALAEVEDVTRYGRVELDAARRVRHFHEKGAGGPGMINAGIYRLRRDALRPFATARSLETEVLPALAASGMAWGWVGKGEFIDVGLPESLAFADNNALKLFDKLKLFGKIV